LKVDDRTLTANEAAEKVPIRIRAATNGLDTLIE
jgi:hypothetical protein